MKRGALPLIAALLAAAAVAAAAVAAPGIARVLWLPVLNYVPLGTNDCFHTCKSWGMDPVFAPWVPGSPPQGVALCAAIRGGRNYPGTARVVRNGVFRVW